MTKAFKLFKQKKGITLIELLAAVTLSSLILMGIYRSFSSSLGIYNWFFESRPYMEAAFFSDEFSMDIMNLSLLKDGYFTGGLRRVSFLTCEDPLDAHPDIGPLKRVEYVFTGGELRKNEYFFGSSDLISTKTVLTNIHNGRFSYSSNVDLQKKEIVFLSNKERIPRMIKFRFRLDETGEEISRVITVPVRRF